MFEVKSRFICLSLLIALVWPGSSGQAKEPREDRFIYVLQAPDVLGERIKHITRFDPESRLQHTKDVYHLELKESRVITHIVRAACGEGAIDEQNFRVMAIQYLSKLPKSFAEAASHDFFDEVYVYDEDNHLRLYEKLSGAQMIELSSRFPPDCVGL